jgi:hypothetical protein
MSRVQETVPSCETKSSHDLPDCNVVSQWFDGDHSADAERIRNDRADAYTVYMSSPSSKGAL